MTTAKLLEDIQAYVEALFRTYQKPHLFYHNIEHTLQVVSHAREISQHYLLEEHQLTQVLAAAWFHDVGHLFGYMKGHEEVSERIMYSFLREQDVDEKTQHVIAKCILATKMPPTPDSLMEMIICDADTYHLGTVDFPAIDALVWHELEVRTAKKFYNKKERSLKFLQTHTYFTSYCQQLLNDGKGKNIQVLQEASP